MVSRHLWRCQRLGGRRLPRRGQRRVLGPATNRQALALTIGEHVEVSNTGGWPVRLRAAGNLDAPTLDAAPEGAVLRVLDGPLSDASGNAWYAVEYDGSTGYASAAYLSWTDAELSERQPAAAVAAAGAGVAAGGNAEVGNTGGWPLRVRAASALDAATLAVAPEGAVVQILDGPTLDGAGNAWYAVNYDGVQGYAGAAYLNATDRAVTARQSGAAIGVSEAAGFAVGAHVEVSNTGGWNLRLREEAGLNGGVVAAADEGTVLVVVSGPVTDGEGNAWYGVDYDGASGFVRASYLSATDRAASVRAAPSAPQVAAASIPAAAPAAEQPAEHPTAPASTAPAAPAAPAPQPVAQAAPAASATGSFIWPAQGSLTQGFGGNVAFYGPGGHNGIDIANKIGTPIVAADGGVVTYAGWKGGLGNAVVIDHGNGFVTEYGHASAIHVSVGQRVSRGQLILSMGSTGNSTGPHCHFSVILNGVYRDPMRYLPK
ncbi:MAG: peptidoglycan DD-metalloendopeptidase family protein [Chloroflexia bacterium]